MKKPATPPKQPTVKVTKLGQPPEAQSDTGADVQLPDDYAQWLDERTFDDTEKQP